MLEVNGLDQLKNAVLMVTGLVMESVSVGSTSLREFEQFGYQLPTGLNDASARRKLAFLSGRMCINKLISHADMKSVALAMEASANGSAVWPGGWSGSISHTQNIVIAVGSQHESVQGVGVDIETIQSSEHCESLHQCYFTPAEKALAGNDTLTTTLIFSIKESVYKLLNTEAPFYELAPHIEVTQIDWVYSTFSVTRPDGDFAASHHSLHALPVTEGCFFKYQEQVVVLCTQYKNN